MPDATDAAQMTLSDFLLARITEDEETARAADTPASIWRAVNWSRKRVDLVHTMRWSPARVLAECEATRRIVELHKAEVMGGVDDCGFACRNTQCPTLALMALPYADHEDFQESWRG